MSPLAPEQLPERQLKFGKWFLLHQPGLHRWLVIILIIINFLLIGFGIVGLVGYYFVTAEEHDRLLLNLTQSGVNYEAHRLANAAQPPQVDRVLILPAGEGRFDFVVRVVNPNPYWALLNFDYEFFYDGVGAGQQQGSLAPGEEKYFVALGVKSDRLPRQANWEIGNLNWRWVIDYPSVVDDRSRFNLSGITYAPSRATGLSERLPVSQASFTVTNASAYSYWQVPIVVLLYRGSNVVGVNQVILDQVLSGQTRSVALNWYEPLGEVTRVDARIQPNLLAASNFMSPSGLPQLFE